MKKAPKRPQTDWILLRCTTAQQLVGFMWAAERAGWDQQDIANFAVSLNGCTEDELIHALLPYSRLGTAWDNDPDTDPDAPRPVLAPLAERGKVNYTLRDENPVVELSGFGVAARWEGWSEDEISAVGTDAITGDREHFLATLEKYCHKKPD